MKPMERPERGRNGSKRGAILLSAALLGAVGCAEPPNPKGATPTATSATAKSKEPVRTARSEQVEAAPVDQATVARLLSIRDEQGGAALVAELERLPADPERAFALRKLVFELLRALNDPGAADALWSFLSRPQQPHFETWAARVLAALGDLRAVPFLAHRLRLDPHDIYGDANAWEQPLRSDDSERIACAGLLADLAELHTWARASITQQAEADLWFWFVAYPFPQPNGLRALASLGSPEHLDELRALAEPQEPLPSEGHGPVSDVWNVAAAAQRYLGRSHHPAAFSVLLQALERRPQELDASIKGMNESYSTVRALILRGLAVGAADGLAELRDGHAFNPLVKHVEDPKNNEFSRRSAGAALGWVGTDKELEQLANRVARSEPSAEREFETTCFLAGLRARPLARVPRLLLPMLDARQPLNVRAEVAAALGRNRLDPGSEAKLLALLGRRELKTHAALALLLGGSTSSALAAVRSYSAATIGELNEAWARSPGSFSDDDVANGTIFRYIENADGVAATLLAGEPQTFARAELGKKLQDLKVASAPHTMRRITLNDRLQRVARGSDLRQAKLAVRAFALLGESGHLFDLSRGTGPVAQAARQAYGALLSENTGKLPAPSRD